MPVIPHVNIQLDIRTNKVAFVEQVSGELTVPDPHVFVLDIDNFLEIAATILLQKLQFMKQVKQSMIVAADPNTPLPPPPGS